MALSKEQKISIVAIIVGVITAIASDEIRCLAGLGCKCFNAKLYAKYLVQDYTGFSFWWCLFVTIFGMAMFIFSEVIYAELSGIIVTLFAGGMIILMIYGVRC